MNKKKKLIIAIAVILAICAIYLVWLLTNKNNDGTVAVTTGNVNNVINNTPNTNDESKDIVIDAGKVTITNLEKWNEFNTSLAPCHEFTISLDLLNALIEGQSDFDEFADVKIGSFEITRYRNKLTDKEFEFNFTVTESKLDTLKAGTYKTVIKEGPICTISFLGNDPRVPENEVKNLSSGAKAICQWIDTTKSRTMPEYGAEEINEIDKLKKCVDYILDRYQGGEKMASLDMKKAIKEKFGVAVNSSVFNELDGVIENNTFYVTKQDKNNTSYAQYSVIGDKTNDEGITTVTVQFFADPYRFIKTDIVEFYIDANEHILGCERIFIGKYQPFEIYNIFTDFS